MPIYLKFLLSEFCHTSCTVLEVWALQTLLSIILNFWWAHKNTTTFKWVNHICLSSLTNEGLRQVWMQACVYAQVSTTWQFQQNYCYSQNCIYLQTQSRNQSARNITYTSAHQQCIENLSASSWNSYRCSWHIRLKGPYASHLPLWDCGSLTTF